MSYAYQGEFNDEVNADFANWLNEKLVALLEEADPVLCEYVTTMVANRKTMGEMSSDLAEFFGENEREEFISSLERKLTSLETATESKNEVQTESKIISLSSSASLKHKALSKPLDAGREGGGGGKGKGDKPKAKQQQQQQQQRGSRPNRLLQAAMEQGKTGNKRGYDHGGGFNKRARGVNDNNVQGMDTMAQMQGFNNANDMMIAYQQNMMTMMQTVLAPVMEATKGLVATRGGRGMTRGGRGGFPSRGRGRGGRIGAGRGETDSSSAGVVAADSTGEGGEESAASNPQDGFVGDGTFDMTSGFRGGGRGYRGRGRFSGRFSTRGGRGRGAPTGPVNKVWKREPDVESALTTGR